MTNMNCANNSKNACIAALEAHLNNFESRRQILEAQVVKQDQAKTEIEDMQFQLKNVQRAIDDLTRNQQQCNDNIYKDFDKNTLKYNKLLDCTGKLKQENHELQCGLQIKTTKEQSKIERIKKLKINKSKTEEQINGLREKIKNKLVIYTYIIIVIIINYKFPSSMMIFLPLIDINTNIILF